MSRVTGTADMDPYKYQVIIRQVVGRAAIAHLRTNNFYKISKASLEIVEILIFRHSKIEEESCRSSNTQKHPKGANSAVCGPI